MKKIFLLLSVLLINELNYTQTLQLPPRPQNALSGTVFANLIWNMPLEQREEEIYAQILSGNIPDFLRELKQVTSSATISGTNYQVTYFVTPDYLAVGSDNDYFLIPMTPLLAQRIANALNCTMPTKKMVDQIYISAPCKLRPQPIPPTAQMTTVPVFAQHNDSVRSIRFPVLIQYPLGTIVGGTKKDVIISNRIYQNLNANTPKPVVIYGWHQLNGLPIQPVYNGHGETYADYSHGIRLLLDSVLVDGVAKTFAQLLADPIFSVLVSDEGIITKPYYTLSGNVTPTPKSFGIFWNGSNSLKISASPTTGTTFKVFYGTDAIFFNDSTAEFTENLILNGLPNDSIFFFRLQAFSSSGYSLFAEVLAAVPSQNPHAVLIVNGFDRGSSGNTNNFIRQHGKAFFNNGYSFSSAANEAVLQGLVSLENYQIVDYILGDESTADETFSTTEQESIKVFLRNGGKLFVSGAEIAWDLDYKGSTTDKDFIYNYLKSQYVNDAPNGQAGVYYQVESISGTIFDGLGIFNFDNGSQGTINVRYPDVINGINGGVNSLKYSNVTNQFAGVNFEGLFPGGVTAGKVVCMGFPFETIYPESKRNLLLEKVISFFNRPVDVKENIESNPTAFHLYQNYPNPFNPSTVISYQLSAFGNVKLTIYDVLGNEISTLINEEKPPGEYEVEFDGSKLSSGVYFYKLKAGSSIQTNKMILMR
jgi:hypothetical protein